MGNCQAAEAATVVIQHPGNKVERVYWSISANQVMNSNPGHYVALVVSSQTLKSENGTPLKQLKLLRPEDTLILGQVYRLISFEDVLKEFTSKKCGKLGKLLERGGHGVRMKHKDSRDTNHGSSSKSDFGSIKVEQEIHQIGSNVSSINSINNKIVGRHFVGGSGQWRPALQSIAEVGT